MHGDILVVALYDRIQTMFTTTATAGKFPAGRP
jgi:hypothetical protein